MARFYTNENVALQVVAELKGLGHDVLTSVEAGKSNLAIPDSEVLAFAAAEDRILISHNRRDFPRLDRQRTQDHAGLVLCTFDADFRALAQRIHAAVSAASEMKNCVIRVNRPG